MNELHAMLHNLMMWLHQQGIMPPMADMMGMMDM